jgi:hypothetical protein
MGDKIMRVKYEIMTENLNLNMIVKIVNSHFSGFSIVKQLGYWEGEQEQSLNIVIFGNSSDLCAVEDIIDRIKTLNKQQSILLSITDVIGKLYS